MLDGSKLLGVPTPRLSTRPLRELTRETTLGFDVAEFAEHVLNLPLLPWQVEFLVRALELVDELDAFGRVVRQRLRFRTVLLLVGRQNGKSTVMIVLALYFMLVYAPGALVLGTAQNLETSEGTWKDALQLLENVPALAAMIPKERGIVRQRGSQTLELLNGSAWKVASATRRGGRGKSARLVMLDELREHLNTEAWAAIANTTVAKADALVLGVSNAGDARSVVLAEQRRKALEKVDDPAATIGIFEWSAEDDAALDDPAGILQANPACGYPNTGMTWETLKAARENSTDNDWRTENLCQWVTVMESGPWAEGVWVGLTDPASRIRQDSPLVVAVDVAIDRTMAYVAVAGWSATEPGRVHVEVIAARQGNAWVGPWLDERFEQLAPAAVVLQGPKGSPSSDLGPVLESLGIPVTWAQGADVTGSAVKFYDAVRDGLVVHLGQPVLDMAAGTASIRPAGDGVFMWDRRRSPVDVAPLVAVSMAWFFLVNEPEPPRRSAYEADDGGLVVV